LRNNHFHTRGEARHAVAAWIDDYNSRRRFLGLADLLCDVA
jgi:putative transposase